MQHSLIGLWSLVSWSKLYNDGHETPYCEEPVGGFIHYGHDGLMAVSIYAKHDQKLITAYAGRYEAMGQEVIHMPLEGNSPHGIQEPKKRHVDLAQQTMHLSTDWVDAERTFKYKLKWQRLN